MATTEVPVSHAEHDADTIIFICVVIDVLLKASAIRVYTFAVNSRTAVSWMAGER